MPSDVVTDHLVTPAASGTVAMAAASLTIHWDGSTPSRFHYLWLRDNAPELLHASTRHRVVETSSIPADVHPASARLTDADALEVVWAHDGLVSTYPGGWLRAHDYSNGARPPRLHHTLWTAAMADEIPRATYPAIANDAKVRIEWLDGFLRYGLAFLDDVPNEPGTVLELASDLGEVRITSWGKVFDVISLDDSNSVAYTNLRLVVHTDEAYRNPVPTIQLQHFLRNEAEGGEATLTDGFRVADDLRRVNPAAFELLARTSLRFHIADAGTDHVGFGPVIEVDGDGIVTAVRFSNHSACPFLLSFDEMEAFYDAYRLFGDMREHPDYRLQIPMGAGTLYMVDNRRVMHGRTGFTRGGARHLQSCYIERDELASRLKVLQRQQPLE
jgi:alpha-ketoglutarate-dependent taurine dioxygenase